MSHDGRWKNPEQVGNYDFDLTARWNTVEVQISGSDGLNFDEVQIECDKEIRAYSFSECAST